MGAHATILLVDDHPGDVRLTKEAFKDGLLRNDLYTVTDGEAALEFIHREGEFADAPRPDIVLLDLVMPNVDGEDILHEIKHHPDLDDVPVFILTGMDDERVEEQDLDHDADKDGVLQKPLDLDEFFDCLREVGGFQLSIVRTEDDAD